MRPSANDPGETQALPSTRPSRNCPRPSPMLVEGSGPGLPDETLSLLRARLRLSALLLAAGLLAFLLYRLTLIGELATPRHWFVFGCHVAVTVSTIGIGWRLCRDCPHFTKHPRVTEALIFGGCGLFFALVSYSALVDGAVYGYIANDAPMWMILIFTYALFIPNTWQRAAVIIGTVMAVAIAILLFVHFTTAGFGDLLSHRSYLKQGIVDNVLVLVLSALVSTWGVYSINSLRREAFEARQLGKYQLRRELGSGGMGVVYLAEHTLLKRPCAIKVIRPDRSTDAGVLARFEREVQATARLTHWNSVEIYDYGHADDGTFYYVMEYLPGMNLDELVRMYGPLHPDRIVRLLKQTCQALREAHEHGLIHRDLKPANIFAAQRGGIYDVAKLLDFGLARPLSVGRDVQITQEGTITGSPLYMSPEQATGESIDERSDIYSLGAVAWFLATGRAPFEDSNPVKVILAHSLSKPQRPSAFNQDIPEALDGVIMKCLEKKPADRPQSVRELHDMLAEVPASGGWTDQEAAEWWNCHGCPQKRRLDEQVLAGQIA